MTTTGENRMRTYDIPYSSLGHELQKIDVFLPAGEANGACIFFIHGGGWSAGDKTGWHTVMEHFCGLGYVCTSVNYRMLPEVHLQEMLEDVRVGMSWVKERAGEYGFDPQRMAAYGSSAGGHLVGMLATIGSEDELGMTDEVTLRDTRPQAAVCMCPVLALPRYKEELLPKLLGEEWASDPQRAPLSSPEYRLTGEEPPFLIVVGDADSTTPLPMQHAFRAACEQQGGSVQLEIISGAEHGAFYGVASQPQKDALPFVERFLATTLNVG